MKKIFSSFLCWALMMTLLLVAAFGLTQKVYAAGATILYVDKNASGVDDGSSWENAFLTLQEALDWSNAHSATSFEIWVAEGIYYPDEGGGRIDNDRSEVFRIAWNNVQIYGGFAGNETQREQRDWIAHRTSLSGNIVHSSSWSESQLSFRVIYLDGETNQPLTGATVLDGITIEYGNSTYAPVVMNGAGLYCAGSGSGNACSPTVRNVTFYNNKVVGRGGGMYCDGSSGGICSPALKNVVFSYNFADVNGGGMYNDNASPTLVNVVFSDNLTINCGALSNNYGNPSLTNVNFYRNQGVTDAGAICNSNNSPTFTNLTISNNLTYSGSSGGISNYSSNPEIVNSIFWGNYIDAVGSSQIYNDTNSTPIIKYSDIEGGCPSGAACGPGMIYSNPKFFAPDADNYRLRADSPVVDAGTNAGVTAGIDLDGAPRKVDMPASDTGSGIAPIVDMGAYETQATIFYVNKEAAGANNGTSWTDAYVELKPALTWAANHAGFNAEIWVAEGSYYPSTTTVRSNYFTVKKNNIQLYGGFSGNETSRSQRDWAAHPTILSGDIGVAGQASDNSYHVMHLDGSHGFSVTSNTIIDGFTIQGGYANAASEDSGAGLYCDGSGIDGGCSPLLVNIIFTGNQAVYGAGMFNDGANGGVSSPVLTNVAFTGNLASYGGGIYNNGVDGGVSSPILTNAVFSTNTVTVAGGGMYNNGENGASHPVLERVIFRGNQADQGGGMANVADLGGASSPVLENALFSGNLAGTQGGAIYNRGAGTGSNIPRLTHVTISGNRADVSGGGMYNDGSAGESSPTLVNCIVWGNEAPGGAQMYNDGAVPNISYSDIEGGCPAGAACGAAILNVDPQFKAPVAASTAPTVDGDYRLLAISPAVDAGNTASTTSIDDLDGNFRKRGSAVDLGAYEAHLVTLTIDVAGTGIGATTPALGDYIYLQGTQVVLSAQADPGDGFRGWGENPDCADGVVTMTSNKMCVATFDHARIYVDQDTVGSIHDGWSWDTAYITLQDALDWTYTDHGFPYEIWVAEGVYYPDEGGSHVADSRSESFTIVWNNVKLYGGFAGDEITREQRDWNTHVTTLSGDIDQDGTLAQNAYHVVYLDGMSHQPINVQTVIDGFTISAGKADGGNIDDLGGGLYCDGRYGNHNCSPTISNVIFSGNTAVKGGGMYNNGAGSDCGSGTWNVHPAGNSNPVMTNVSFVGNSAVDGGGVYNDGTCSGISSPSFTNVLFSNNQAVNGGAIYNVARGEFFYGYVYGQLFYFEFPGYSSPILNNVTVSDNHAVNMGGGIMNVNNVMSQNHPILKNSILWGNTAPDGPQTREYEDGYTGLAYDTNTFSFSIVEGGCPYWDLCGSGMLYTDPLFVATSTADYRLQGASPAIDSGANAGCPESDLRDEPRKDLACDIGAFELQLSDSPVVSKTIATSTATYSFGPTFAEVEVLVSGDCASLTVQLTNSNHSFALWPGLQTGAYWKITPQPVGCSGLSANLRLPAFNFTPHPGDKVCRWVATGSYWDCGQETENSPISKTLLRGVLQGYIQRLNVSSFSEWTLGYDVGTEMHHLVLPIIMR